MGSLEAGLLLAKRPTRRGGGSSAAWREGGLFFLLGGGETVNAAMVCVKREGTRATCLNWSRVEWSTPPPGRVFWPTNAMLVDAYGSDNSDNSGDEHTPRPRSSPQQKNSISLSFPAPSHSSASGSSNLNLPAPKVKKAPKKIAIDLPALPKDDSVDRDSDEARPAKKPRTDARGAGSALFSRLPAPKLAAPVKAAPERILGSGKGPGLVFNNLLSQRTQDTSGTPSNFDSQTTSEVTEKEQSVSLPFTPVSVSKGKANVSLEEFSSKGKIKALDSSPPAATDLFSLSTSCYYFICFGHRTFHSRLCEDTVRLYSYSKENC